MCPKPLALYKDVSLSKHRGESKDIPAHDSFLGKTMYTQVQIITFLPRKWKGLRQYVCSVCFWSLVLCLPSETECWEGYVLFFRSSAVLVVYSLLSKQLVVWYTTHFSRKVPAWSVTSHLIPTHRSLFEQGEVAVKPNVNDSSVVSTPFIYWGYSLNTYDQNTSLWCRTKVQSFIFDVYCIVCEVSLNA